MLALYAIDGAVTIFSYLQFPTFILIKKNLYN